MLLKAQYKSTTVGFRAETVTFKSFYLWIQDIIESKLKNEYENLKFSQQNITVKLGLNS